MPHNSDCAISELKLRFKPSLAVEGRVQVPMNFPGTVASQHFDFNPNLLEGFIPPGELLAR